MFDVFETDVLFYNIFGYIQINADEIILKATAVKLNADPDKLERSNTQVVEHELKLYQTPFIISFGAWVTEKDIKFAVGKLEGYEREVYEANKDFIDKQIRSISSRFNRLMDK